MSTVETQELMHVIGGNVRRLRESSGMSQTVFAEKVRLPQSYISDLETGKCAPRVATMAKLADALAVEPSELLISKAVA